MRYKKIEKIYILKGIVMRKKHAFFANFAINAKYFMKMNYLQSKF